MQEPRAYGIHELKFGLSHNERLDFRTDIDQAIDSLFHHLFRLTTLTEVYPIKFNNTRIHHYQSGYKYRDRIFVYLNAFNANQDCVTVEIKGCWFDEATDEDISRVFNFIHTYGGTIKTIDLHLTEKSNFDKFYRLHGKESYTSHATHRTPYKDPDSKARTIYVGAEKSDQVLCMYEKGRMPNSPYLQDAVRFELRQAGGKAKAFWKEWGYSPGQENLLALPDIIRSLIAGVICYRNPKDKDPIMSRREVDKDWLAFTRGVQARVLKIPRKPPEILNQIKAFTQGLERSMERLGPALAIREMITTSAAFCKIPPAEIRAHFGQLLHLAADEEGSLLDPIQIKIHFPQATGESHEPQIANAA